MQTTEVRIAREQRRSIKVQADKELVLALLRNPAFQIIASYVIIEYLQKQKIIPELAGTIAEGAVLSTVALQQIAPLVPDILKSTGESFAALAKMVPMLAAVGAGG